MLGAPQQPHMGGQHHYHGPGDGQYNPHMGGNQPWGGNQHQMRGQNQMMHGGGGGQGGYNN